MLWDRCSAIEWVCLSPSFQRMCFYWRRTTQRAFSSLEFSHLQGKANSNIELAANFCIYMRAHVFVCVFAKYWSWGDDGVSGKMWSHLKAVKKGNGHSFTNKYLILVHPTACHCDETDIWVVLLNICNILSCRKCVICSVMSRSQFKCKLSETSIQFLEVIGAQIDRNETNFIICYSLCI